MNTRRSGVEVEAIRAQLARLLQDELFEQSERLSRFLRFIVEEELAGRGDRVNQYAVAFEAFDREPSFDPLADSIVRVEARRLRSKLTEYYAGTGRDDPVVITMPKGRYRAHFEDAGRDSAQAPASGAASGTGLETPVIAVLPFDNFSGDPEQEYFSDGITEDIITDLSKISGLRVISRHSTFVYKGRSRHIRDVSEDLGASHILEGSVRKSGNQVRITAQLIDASIDNHLWAERYDRQLDDIFAIQDDVSRKIVSALKLRLTRLEKERLGHQGTTNLEAHDLYLRAQEQFYRFTEESLEHADRLLLKCIEVDHSFAAAHAWRSRVLLMALISGVNPSRQETIEPALASARQAVDLDPLLPLAHASLGWALMWNREIDQAVAAADRALELDANFADAFLWHSLIQASAGMGREALESIERAIDLNPHYTVTYLMALGMAFFTMGDYQEALNHFERGIRRKSSFIFNHLYRTATLGLLGRESEARQARTRLQEFKHYRSVVHEAFFFNDETMFRRVVEGLSLAGIETRLDPS